MRYATIKGCSEGGETLISFPLTGDSEVRLEFRNEGTDPAAVVRSMRETIRNQCRQISGEMCVAAILSRSNKRSGELQEFSAYCVDVCPLQLGPEK